MDWQPINTAPKDGTTILVANRQGVVGAVYRMKTDKHWYIEDAHMADGESALTHWMPLPEAPK